MLKYPKNVADSIPYRDEINRLCKASVEVRERVRGWCKNSLLFWLNTFGWTHDPRKIAAGEDPVVPFVTWPFQDEALREMEAAFGKHDLCVVKSRCMGASWMVMALFTHRWQFHHNLALGVVSREERLVDGSPKSLMAKIDFLLKHQPPWLVPDYRRKELLFVNNVTGSTIEGAATTGNVFAGDRYTAAMMDELGRVPEPDGRRALAASQFATHCRFFNSTPLGNNGAFYDVAHNPNIKRIDLWWHRHPDYREGLEKRDSIRGGYWSPAFQRECDRLAISALIASEMLLDFAGSASPFFDEEIIAAHEKLYVRPPVMRKTFRTKSGKSADLLLWDFLEPPPREEQYVAGTDLSWGTGATPSVLSVACRRTREQVAECATAHLDPDEFAEVVVAACKWFNNADLIWELAGPGVPFGKRIEQLGYARVYLRQDEMGLTHKVQKSLTPGWVPTPANKLAVLQEYARCLKMDAFVNRSAQSLRECRTYVYLPNGQVGNSRAQNSVDLSAARQNHGDRVIATALACKLLGTESAIQDDGQPKLSEDPAILLPGHPLHYTQHARMLAAKMDERDDDGWGEQERPTWQNTNRRYKKLEW